MTNANENPRGLPVAWRIKWSPDFPESDELLSDGERLIACQALETPPYIDALVLATDYAALQADLAAAIARAEELEAMNHQQAKNIMQQETARRDAETRAEAAERDAQAWRQWCEAVGAEQVAQLSEKFGDALGLVRDAERYRWLRESGLAIAWNAQVSYSPGYAEVMDAAIDAAMAAKGREDD